MITTLYNLTEGHTLTEPVKAKEGVAREDSWAANLLLGFAWFSAAYGAYCLVLKEVDTPQRGIGFLVLACFLTLVAGTVELRRR